MALAVNDANFKEVITNEKPILVDFWATWCGPCRALSPIVDEIAITFEGKAIVAKCNIDESAEIAMEYKVRNVPTLLFFKGGEVKDKLVGSATKAEITEKLNSLL